MPKGEILDLVRSAAAAPEVVHAIDSYRAEAGDGKLIGFAIVAMYRGYQYTVEIVGETSKVPTFTRGMLLLLDDRLRELVTKQEEGL